MLSENSKVKLLNGIRGADKNGALINWDDNNLSFCVTKFNESICVSVGEISNEPNKDSLSLPFLTDVLGPVDTTRSRRSSLNPSLTIFYMMWDHPKVISKSSIVPHIST